MNLTHAIAVADYITKEKSNKKSIIKNMDADVLISEEEKMYKLIYLCYYNTYKSFNYIY